MWQALPLFLSHIQLRQREACPRTAGQQAEGLELQPWWSVPDPGCLTITHSHSQQGSIYQIRQGISNSGWHKCYRFPHHLFFSSYPQSRLHLPNWRHTHSLLVWQQSNQSLYFLTTIFFLKSIVCLPFEILKYKKEEGKLFYRTYKES